MTDLLRNTCETIARSVASEHAPELMTNFEELFDAVYDVAPEAEPSITPPLNVELGQEALDSETLRQLTIMGMIVVPTYRLVAGIVGPAVRDTLAYSIERNELKSRIRKECAELTLRWPQHEKWIALSAHFAESVLRRIAPAERKGVGEK